MYTLLSYANELFFVDKVDMRDQIRKTDEQTLAAT